MLQKTESSAEIQAVVTANRSDVGIADVWLHKNIEQTTSTDEDGNTLTAYVADEVYFQHAYSDTLESELTESFDEWWEYGKTWEPAPVLTETETQIAANASKIEVVQANLDYVAMMADIEIPTED